MLEPDNKGMMKTTSMPKPDRGAKVVIKGTITSQGKYANGEDICEIYIHMAHLNALPHSHGQKTPILMTIGQDIYEAGVHETKKGVVWISSVLHRMTNGNEKARLVNALAAIRLGKGDTVSITTSDDGTFLLQ